MTELTDRFIQHFGEMGSRWGINRTVGQMYALLVASPEALNADDIAEALQCSRSNVSMALKELDGWQLLARRYIPGDRREYFSAHGDAWEIFRRLADQRHQREIAPTLSLLREALMTPSTDPADAHLRARMREMHDLIDLLTGWFREVQKLDRSTLERLLQLGSGVVKLLEMTEKLGGGSKAKPKPLPRIEPVLVPPAPATEA